MQARLHAELNRRLQADSGLSIADVDALARIAGTVRSRLPGGPVPAG